jgi:CHAT domain-containing protein
MRLAEAQSMLRTGAALLEYHTFGDDLVVAAVSASSVDVEVSPVVSRELAALVNDFHTACSIGWGHVEAADRLSRLLLEPIRDVVMAHERLVIVPFGPLALVPFHALPFAGGPLGLTSIVSYAPSAAAALAGGLDRPCVLDRPLVVGDPAFDPDLRPRLPRLAAARVEALAVAARLGSPDPLVDLAATEEAVRGRLPGCSVLHLATHGLLQELVPYGSSLVLAGRDELTVAELVGVQVGADLAVLSACDTGRGAATLGGDVVGLTRAMRAAGVRQTVVSLWPVDDAIACLTMDAFYSGLLRGQPAALALHQAQLWIHGVGADQVREAYSGLAHWVGVGAEPSDAEFRRRGELDDDEEIPPALSGSAERWWAPFMLVS